jgi:hypothetical protein
MTDRKTTLPTLLASLTALAIGAAGCGQEPSFLDNSQKRITTQSQSSGKGSGDAQGTGTDAQTSGDLPGADGSNGSQVSTNTSGGTGTGTASDQPDVPAADPGDLDAIHKCMNIWGPNSPFTGTVQNYEKIAAAVTVGGIGNAINDTQATQEPFLILIDAGVNVLGSPTYNLLNPNGWYCMKVNVNVLTTLTVNLDCNAHLADSRVDVNVLSNQNNNTAAVGVHVLSTVNVDTIRPQGETCSR